jgi:hypothetical protein
MVQLIQPVSDAIHQFEADRPRLPEILPTWVKLARHFAAFDDEYKLVGEARTLRVFLRRFAVHYQKEWTAAFALDPANAKLEDGTWTFPLALRDLPEPTAPNGAPLEFNFGPKNGQRVMQPTHILSCVVDLVGADNKAAITAELNKLKLRGLSIASELGSMLEHVAGRTTVDGKVMKAPLLDRLAWWRTHAAKEGLPLLAKAAVKLLSCHSTSCASERNWSLWGNIYVKTRSNLALERATKLITIRHNSAAAADYDIDDEEVTMALLEAPL